MYTEDDFVNGERGACQFDTYALSGNSEITPRRMF